MEVPLYPKCSAPTRSTAAINFSTISCGIASSTTKKPSFFKIAVFLFRLNSVLNIAGSSFPPRRCCNLRKVLHRIENFVNVKIYLTQRFSVFSHQKGAAKNFLGFHLLCSLYARRHLRQKFTLALNRNPIPIMPTIVPPNTSSGSRTTL